MAQIHRFTEYAQLVALDPAALHESACVTGDAARMHALYVEMEDAILRAQAAGEQTLGQVLEVPFLEIEAEAAAAVDGRAQDYYEQMLALDAAQLEAKAAA